MRAARGLSQQELAKAISCSPSAISLIESGQRQPSIEMAQRIAGALKAPFDLFIVLSSGKWDDCGMDPKDAEFIGRRILTILTEK